MKLHILIVIFLLFCTSCREKQVNYLPSNISIPHTNPFISKWTYGFPFYSAELVINQDGTFKFHDQGCMGHQYTEGNWMQIGNKAISLQSFEDFKQYKEPNVSDTTNVYFDNIRLILRDEFLYCPDPNGFMGEAFFSANKNYR